MKIIKKFPLICLLFLIASSLTGAGRAMAQPGVSISVQAFYGELAPYGRWIDYGEYGRAWIPSVEADFQPYGTRGHWVVTEYGNTWVSDYDWGWAPFHYGRWVYDDYYGWIWVPGSEWGPAWVSWRSGGGYYGWAPLGPGMDISININIPLLRWIFVPERYIMSSSVYAYCYPRSRSVNIYRSTTIINNIYVRDNRRYFYGPRPQEIERATRSRVTVHHIDYSDRPGRAIASNGSLRIYRPDISRDRGRPSWNNDRPSANYPDNRRSPGNDRNPAYGRPGSSPSRNGDVPSSSPGNNNSRTERPSWGSQQNNSADRQNDDRNREAQQWQSQNNQEQRNNEDAARREQQRQSWNNGQEQKNNDDAARREQQRQSWNNGQEQRTDSRREAERQQWNNAEQRNSNQGRTEEQRPRYSAPEQRQSSPERPSPSTRGGNSGGNERSSRGGGRPSRR